MQLMGGQLITDFMPQVADIKTTWIGSMPWMLYIVLITKEGYQPADHAGQWYAAQSHNLHQYPMNQQVS